MDEPARLDVSACAPGTSVLLLAPDPVTGRDVLQTALGDADEDVAVLIVTTGDAQDSVDALRERGVPPDAIGVVDASSARTTPSGVAEAKAGDGPGSLSKLGIAISDVLDRLSHRYDRVVVGLDSTSGLLEAAPLPPTFRFLHVLGGRIRSADAVLLATMDRTAHDEETRLTVAELFDETATID